MSNAGYTFSSVSTAKPGKLDELIKLADRTNALMDGKIPGLLGRQTCVDRDRNTVVVWATFENKSDLYDWMATQDGASAHDSDVDMNEVIETFEMYDLTPVTSRL